MGNYTLYIDDNYHFMDPDARSVFGNFETEDEAIRAARMLVNDSLRDAYRPGMTPEELLAAYKAYGEDPWLTESNFSAWTYAEQRCWEICIG